jgi:hypothetical protein
MAASTTELEKRLRTSAPYSSKIIKAGALIGKNWRTCGSAFGGRPGPEVVFLQLALLGELMVYRFAFQPPTRFAWYALEEFNVFVVLLA